MSGDDVVCFKYTLSYRFPPGRAKDMIFLLSEEAGGQVCEAYKVRNESPHFTLKYWFTAEDHQLDDLLLALETFAMNTPPAAAWLSGIGNFSRRVAYVTQERSDQADQLVQSLMSLLSSFRWMQWREYDDKVAGPMPHSSVALDEHDGVTPELLDNLIVCLGKEKIPFLIDNICVSRRPVDQVFTGYNTTPGGAMDVDNVWRKFELTGAPP